jgi:hypothetical protein
MCFSLVNFLFSLMFINSSLSSISDVTGASGGALLDSADPRGVFSAEVEVADTVALVMGGGSNDKILDGADVLLGGIKLSNSSKSGTPGSENYYIELDYNFQSN